MGLEEKKKVWKDMSVSSVAQEIGQEYFSNVQVSLDPDPQLEKPLNQDGKTDLAFSRTSHSTYHAKCFVELDENDEEVLYFIPERRIVTTRRADKLVLRYRTGPTSNLIELLPVVRRELPRPFERGRGRRPRTASRSRASSSLRPRS